MNDQPFYKTSVWQKCRESILSRDLYLCQECLEGGVLTPADTVHHIIHLKDDPSKALDEDNLVSVCSSCHNKLHPEKSNKKQRKKISNRIRVVEVKSNVERP
ncbi:HNH endonuclease signature motif containing protein [Terrihalobacillus insolitus]|uniref:HNH endonuclease signature motif containing protein n=1 Tax=Terrihalobacillus insolitus TaxID=2950438 RepID=UPI002340CC91|nr:HNH endonuclease signature motif containing protein [Terrihalobacillus insolitus]MDC3412540.1 HNH endonuclease [Terrihalobacillus insolitus]